MEINLDDCWIYAGNLSKTGYGRISLSKGFMFAHRAMWESANNQPIPEGLVIDHLCRVPPCINPIHLEPVTPRENTLRGIGLAAQLAKRTHCKHGHEFTKENTRMQGNTRRCRKCCCIWQKQRKERVRCNGNRLGGFERSEYRPNL